MRVLRGGARAPYHRRLVSNRVRGGFIDEWQITRAIRGGDELRDDGYDCGRGRPGRIRRRWRRHAVGGRDGFQWIGYLPAFNQQSHGWAAKQAERIFDGRSVETIPFPTQDPNHYHEIKLIGRFTQDESGLTVDRQLVRMRVDGRSIPMSIDGDQMSNSLQFDQGDELGQNLYRLILSKQLEVVGNQQLRARIADAAAANRSKQIVVDGFVYDRTTPYLVLVSVGDAP